MKSPLSIEIIIHYYTAPGDYRKSPASQQIIQDLVTKGILQVSLSGERQYEPNQEACRVYIEALGRVPYPTHEWTLKYTPTKKEHYDGERPDLSKFLINHLDNRPWWEFNSTTTEKKTDS